MIKVLWLDDDFAPISLTDDPGVRLRRENFQDTADDAEKYGIKIEDTALKLEDFVQKLEENSHRYDAVILDILGLNPVDSTDQSVMYQAINYIKDYHGMLCYVFSNNIIQHKGYLDTNLAGQYFEKSKSKELYSKIRDDFKSNYSYYVGHEYILECLRKGWLDREIGNSALKSVMEKYANKDVDAPHGNDMRKIVENMLRVLNVHLDTPLNAEGNEDQGRSRQIVNEVVKKGHSRLMKGPLDYMLNIINDESHHTLHDAERKYFFDADYSTFFLVCHWFHTLMKQFENPNKESVVKTIRSDKKNTSIRIPTYRDDKGELKIKIEPSLPESIKENDLDYVYVVRIDKTKNGWSAFCDIPKTLEQVKNSEFKAATYTLKDKILEAYSNKK